MEPNHWTTAKAKTARQKYKKKQTEMVQVYQKMNTECKLGKAYMHTKQTET